MAVVTLAELKEQVAFTDDIGDDDDDLLRAKIDAAEGYVQTHLGYTFAERYTDQSAEVPETLKEAVKQLAAFWYSQRETVVIGSIVSEVPYGVDDMILAYRDWSF